MDSSLTTRCKVRHGPDIYDCAVSFDGEQRPPCASSPSVLNVGSALGNAAGLGLREGSQGISSTEQLPSSESSINSPNAVPGSGNVAGVGSGDSEGLGLGAQGDTSSWDAGVSFSDCISPSMDACSWDDDSSDGGSFSGAGVSGERTPWGASDPGALNPDADPNIAGGVGTAVAWASAQQEAGAGLGLTATVYLPCQDQGLAAGQFAVFYQGDTCMGSAVILDD